MCAAWLGDCRLDERSRVRMYEEWKSRHLRVGTNIDRTTSRGRIADAEPCELVEMSGYIDSM
jgi:hypothetical protein